MIFLPNFRNSVSQILEFYKSIKQILIFAYISVFSQSEKFTRVLCSEGLTPGVLISDLGAVHTLSPSRPKEGIHQRHYLLFSRSHKTGTSNERFWQLLWQMGASVFTTYQYRVPYLNSVKNKYILQENVCIEWESDYGVLINNRLQIPTWLRT